MWEKLSRETRGLLEGLYAARSAVALQHAAGVEPSGEDARLAEVVAPLRVSVMTALGGARPRGGGGAVGGGRASRRGRRAASRLRHDGAGRRRADGRVRGLGRSLG